MKKICLIVLVTLLLVFPSCTQPPEEKEEVTVLISGEIGQEPYSMPVGSDIAYHGDLTITNIGKEPLVFNVVEKIFSPIKGKSLKIATHSPEGQEFRIPPGDSDIFDFNTDGYTSSLLADAEGSPLILIVVLKLNGQTVAGPFMAALPEPWDLPDYYEKLTEGKKLAPLNFY